MRISDWSSDVCSSDLIRQGLGVVGAGTRVGRLAEVLRIAGIDEADLNTHGPERVGEEVPGAAVEAAGADDVVAAARRSEEHTSELQSLMRISYAVFCLKKKKKKKEQKRSKSVVAKQKLEY